MKLLIFLDQGKIFLILLITGGHTYTLSPLRVALPPPRMQLADLHIDSVEFQTSSQVVRTTFSQWKIMLY